MFEVLTGAGLAAAAGLNAYIPLLVLGLLSAHTDLVALPAGWAWLENGWVQLILVVLLLVEIVADKIPAVDTVNDVIQTVVRPAAGGIVFGSGAVSETATVTDPASFFSSNQWVPIVAGILLALVVHGAKAFARPVANTVTAGVAAPVLSGAEDATSVALSFAALLVPLLVVLLLVLMVVAAVLLIRRRMRLRRARRDAAASAVAR
jgi:hypothetical protein